MVFAKSKFFEFFLSRRPEMVHIRIETHTGKSKCDAYMKGTMRNHHCYLMNIS
jgi:hypothetical protein